MNRTEGIVQIFLNAGDVKLFEVEKIMRQFLSGKPTELTESSPEIMVVREIIKSGVWYDSKNRDYDFGCDTYWNEQKTIAVYVPD